jgi:hypothetical protein
MSRLVAQRTPQGIRRFEVASGKEQELHKPTLVRQTEVPVFEDILFGRRDPLWWPAGRAQGDGIEKSEASVARYAGADEGVDKVADGGDERGREAEGILAGELDELGGEAVDTGSCGKGELGVSIARPIDELRQRQAGVAAAVVRLLV